MKRVLTLMLALTTLGTSACDKTDDSATSAQPPDWVKEAQERSKAAQQVEAPDPEPDVELVVEKPLLWEVKSPTGATSHLLGTFHVGTDFQGLPALPKSVRDAFERDDVLVLEIDTGLADLGPIDQYVVNPDGRSLERMLKPEQWDVLVEQSGLPPQKLERMQPAVALSAVVSHWTPNAGVRGMDGRFNILGRAHEKKLVYLETPIEQAALMSKQVTAKMLGNVLDAAADQKAAVLQADKDFRAGDAEAVERYVFDPEQVKANPSFFEAVFWDRNAKWVDTLIPMLESGKVLVVVGVGHLLGERSVPAKLQEAGFEVRRVGK